MAEIKKKNILIIGQGGVPCALAKKLKTYEQTGEIYIAPGNGIDSQFYKNVDIREEDSTGLLKFALENNIDLTIPISEKHSNQILYLSFNQMDKVFLVQQKMLVLLR